LQLLKKCSQLNLKNGQQYIAPALAVVLLKALMRSGLRLAVADGELGELAVRAGVQDALTEAGLADLVDEAKNLRGRLAGKFEDPS
jgi:hypothetical protein